MANTTTYNPKSIEPKWQKYWSCRTANTETGSCWDGLRCFLPVVKRSAPKRQCPKAAKEKKGRPQRLQRKRNQCSQQSVPLCKAVPQYQKTPTKKAILPRQQRIHLAQPASYRRDPKSQRPFESINCLTRFSGF